MARGKVAAAAAALVLVTVLRATAASAQPCSCCACAAEPEPPPRQWDPSELPPGPVPDEALVPDPRVDSRFDPSASELEGVMIGGATAAIASYVVGVLAARTQPHTNAAIDNIPIAGAVASAARNTPDGRNTPLLLFSASVQAMGLLVIAATATDLAALRRMAVDVEAGPSGCGVSLSWRLP